MQNLTARYNSIYNSKAMLDEYQIEEAENYIDDYEQILPVYLGPAPNFQSSNQDVDLQSMNEIIRKAQLIILEKRFSSYIDDAYILVGKANFFKGNYFDAVEYFDYTIKTYKQNRPIYIEALDWKARSLLQLKKVSDASVVIDTLDSILNKIKPKKELASSFATIAQMHIYLKNNAEAISYLKRALKTGGKTYSRNRWTYILAQLYEKQNNYKDATANYRKVQLSNAPFATYFNAILNQIKLDTLYTGNKVDKQYQLLKLLKEDKNFDYQDQIYYHIAESYAASQQFPEAEKYYLLSVQKANVNQNQKGLSFLKMADLNFRFSKDYLTAKSYYDSTITTLSKNYPGYDLILKKSVNLKYLTDRYEAISLQDSLQAIALLPTELRETRIKTLANPVSVKKIENTLQADNVNPTRRESKTSSQNTFYFSNQMAIAMGFTEFKRKWGNRGLENNWRQSTKTNILETNRSIDTSANSVSVSSETSSQKTNETLIAEYTAALPLTPDLRAKSNNQIIDAFYEIGAFYLYELNDVVEAENIYKTLLARFPSNNYLASIYYSLYLINKEKEPTEASRYKDLILKDFSNSIYAKTIIDPGFSIKQSAAETAANDNYNNLFAKYLNKDFNDVIKQTDEILSAGGSNYLHPQLAYLKAISIGRTNNVDSLIVALNIIKDKFPNDQLITPLVKQHLAYLLDHMPYFKNRQIALIDFDPSESPFDVPQKQVLVAAPKITPEQAPVEKSQVVPTIPSGVTVKAAEVQILQNDTATPKVLTDGTFTNAISSNYYFVIRVSDASLTLSSSRFGVGQFNRGNYSGSDLRHQLKEFDNDQLIYVGNFSNFDDVKSYAAGITPQLKQIMKVPVSIYSNFIISKENFDKLTSRELLDKYLEFYQKNIKNE